VCRNCCREFDHTFLTVLLLKITFKKSFIPSNFTLEKERKREREKERERERKKKWKSVSIMF
jgi:hypothetical protein